MSKKKKNDPADKYEVCSANEVFGLFNRIFTIYNVEQDHVIDGILDPSCLCIRCEKKRAADGGVERSKCRHALRQLNRQLKQESDRKLEQRQREKVEQQIKAATVIQLTWRDMIPEKRKWDTVTSHRAYSTKKAIIVMLSKAKDDQTTAIDIGKAFELLHFNVEYWAEGDPDPATHPTKANLARLVEQLLRPSLSELLVVYIVANTSSGPLQGYVSSKRQTEEDIATTPRGRLRRTFTKSISNGRNESHVLRYILPSDMVKECCDSVVLLDDILEIITRVPTVRVGQYNCPLGKRLLLVDGSEFALVSSTVSAEVLYDYSVSRHAAERGLLSILLLRGLYGGAIDKAHGITMTSIVKYIAKGMIQQKVKAHVKDTWGIPPPLPVVPATRLKRIRQAEQAHVNEKSRYEQILQHEPWKFTRTPWDLHQLVVLAKGEQLCTDLQRSFKNAQSRKSITKLARLHSEDQHPLLAQGPMPYIKYADVTLCISSMHPTHVTPVWIDDTVEYINHLTGKEGRISTCTVHANRQLALQCRTSYKEMLVKEKCNAWKTSLDFKYTIEGTGEGECVVKIQCTEDEALAYELGMLEDIFGSIASLEQLITVSCTMLVGTYCYLTLLARSGVVRDTPYEPEPLHDGTRRSRHKAESDIVSLQQRQLVRSSLRMLEVHKGLLNLCDMDNYSFRLCTKIVSVCITGQSAEQRAKQQAVVAEAAQLYTNRQLLFYYFEYHSWERDAKLVSARSPQLYALINHLVANTHFTGPSAFPQPFLSDFPNGKTFTLSADRARKATVATLIQFIEEYHKGSLDELVPPVKGSKVSGWGSHQARYLLLPAL